MSLRKLLLWGAGLSALAALVVLLAWSLRWATTAALPVQFRLPPNIVLVSLDTTRPDHLGCYGYGRHTSPNLDRIAQQGVRFNTARSQFPMTLPAHVSLFTSMLPSHHGIDHLNGFLPPTVPTLAQSLRSHGYTTAALVNDAQVGKRWGCDSGFESWREFVEGKPEGNCANLTAEAVTWLRFQPRQPFFLFLHYYDPHAPYNPPAAYREAFGSNLSGRAADQLYWSMRRPENRSPNPTVLQEFIGSYDGEIAWLDHELGALFNQLPDNTLLVIFSDHGEEFKEHGWLGHGSTTYEEAIRSVLILQHPTLLPPGIVIDEPVMLVDVMPTLLNLCGIQPPPTCEGTDLSPLWGEEGRLPERYCFAEAKTPFDGRVLKVVYCYQWKLVYSVLDGKMALYRLPDEDTDRARDEPTLLKTLFGVLREWLEEEDYWTLYAHGRGVFTANMESLGGDIAFHLVVDDHEHDRTREWMAAAEPERQSSLRSLRWTYAADGKTRGIYFQLAPAEARVRFDLQIDGKRVPAMTFIGDGRTHPPQVPWAMGPLENISGPVVAEAFQPPGEGFYLKHHRGKKLREIKSHVVPLDAKTLEQLRSLGYLR